MGDKTAGNLICNLAQKREVIGGEVLITFLVGYLKDTDCMVSKLNRDEKNVAYDLMQLLVHSHVFAKLISDVLVLGSLEMSGLSRVEYLTQHIWLVTFSLEAHRLSQSASDDFAEKLILDSIVEEYRAALNVEQIGKHFNQTWQIELKRIIKRYISSDIE